ncbi:MULTISPECIES: toll/interleukin-1 receptor domain-containing protein [Rhizobium/Agrobacterium group]|uniref:toll/interleukin-1 receptor domain-containing protein n=1 Tax=Rhizobium/Agrobacterium group TaxID=227290 RepID=UPI000B3FFB92|nr:toll/interleukin-1 receptor domain-containing protein [Allorhizobium ampelinum]NSZ43351.1 toll/interleukin-1 receptor domain-containing protein [Agrobacterium vitis]NTA27008.1 toll/interleukin-1 receptor domain-containing protein [Allorhizobium ampelinum]OVE94108.1 hypothetical protein B7W85_10970 [Allorhizobium ampelinum]
MNDGSGNFALLAKARLCMVILGARAGVVMADQVPTIDEIENKETLAAYLKTRPVEEAQIVALRSSLRIMPMSVPPSSTQVSSTQRLRLIVSVFRCNLIGWAACNFPDHEMRDAADAAGVAIDAHSTASGIAATAGTAARTAAAAVRSVTAHSAAASRFAVTGAATFLMGAVWAGAASGPVARAFWQHVRIDLQGMRDQDRSSVLHSRLWLDREIEPYIEDIEAAFQRRTILVGEHWQPVWDFYSAIRAGRRPFEHLGSRQEEVIVDIATAHKLFWKRNTNVVMKELSDLLRVDAKFQSPVLDSDSGFETDSNVDISNLKSDFFISYSTKNDFFAREINGYLEGAGFSTIAQFKDFPVGSNFVIEMQEGLERGARAIALLSPDYVASDHCRAEWAAIYNMDPIGKRRKLVSFLLEPTELNKLQRQIVYSSLIGLKQDARRKAVLDAIRHMIEVVTPDQLKQKLADIASPDVAVTADGKIDVTPNAKYDLAVNSPDLPDLPTSLRALCTIIEASLPENSPKTIAPTLQGYRGHLEERGANPAIGFLGMLVAALTKEFESADFEFWGSGLNEHFESFFACHSKFLGHFPRSGEREQTYAEAEIDEDEASGDDLIQPVQSVADAVEELKAIGKVTPGLERVVQGQVQIAKDVSSLPLNLSEDAGKGNVITPKRRFVLSQLGFWERMLAAVGSMTTLATTPQGQAAIAALQDAIAKFLSLIR